MKEKYKYKTNKKIIMALIINNIYYKNAKLICETSVGNALYK